MEQQLPSWANTLGSLTNSAANLFTAIKGGPAPESAESKVASESAKRQQWLPFIILGALALGVIGFLALRRK